MATGDDNNAKLLQAAVAAAADLRTVPAALHAAAALAGKCYDGGDVEPLVYVQMLLQRLAAQVEAQQVTIEDALQTLAPAA